MPMFCIYDSSDFLISQLQREYPSMKFKHIKRTLEIKVVVDADKIYGKDLYQQLPKDYWDFVPTYPQQLSSSFEMTLLPYQVWF